MKEINWTYDAMYKWYTKQDQINEESKSLIAIVYEAKKPSKKNQHNVEPFVKDNIKFVGLSPIQDKKVIKEDIFLVYDHNKSNKQWLYLVYPTITKCTNSDTLSFLAANHFSFCYDKSDKKKQCHFHSTEYLCNIKYDTPFYWDQHTNDYMPDKLHLPNDTNNIFKKHPFNKEFLINFIAHPWHYDTKIGGSHKHRNNKDTRIANPIRNSQFCNLWIDNKFKRMTAFGIKDSTKDSTKYNTGTKYHWTVTFKEPGRHIQGRLIRSYVFTTNEGDDHETVLQQKIVELL